MDRAVQCVRGFRSKVERVEGEVVILAEYVPSWLLVMES